MSPDAPMPLCIPTNFQADYLDHVDLAGVEQVYGKLDRDPIGGGRAAVILPSVRRQDAIRHIRAIRDRGASFNYLLNASCLGNTEYSASGRRRIDDFIRWVSDAGADTVTVTIPYLLEIVKRQAPHLKIAVSTIALVDTPESADAWARMGADKITLSVTDLNRDFDRIRRIRSRVDLHLQLLANLDCLQGCPYRSYHGNMTSHASQDADPTGGFVVDWCYLSCSADRLREPARLGRRPRHDHRRHQRGDKNGDVGVRIVDRTIMDRSQIRRSILIKVNIVQVALDPQIRQIGVSYFGTDPWGGYRRHDAERCPENPRTLTLFFSPHVCSPFQKDLKRYLARHC